MDLVLSICSICLHHRDERKVQRNGKKRKKLCNLLQSDDFQFSINKKINTHTHTYMYKWSWMVTAPMYGGVIEVAMRCFFMCEEYSSGFLLKKPFFFIGNAVTQLRVVFFFIAVPWSNFSKTPSYRGRRSLVDLVVPGNLSHVVLFLSTAFFNTIQHTTSSVLISCTRVVRFSTENRPTLSKIR